MASDDVSETTVTLPKHPTSSKHRMLTRAQSTTKSFVDDFRINRTRTATNRSSFKLANVLSTAGIYPSTPDTPQLRRYRSPSRDFRSSSPSKIERHLTALNSQTRLPSLYMLTNDVEKKQAAEFHRRQIYALNHLMRELEQEKFRQFCKLHSIGTVNKENAVINAEDTNKQTLI